MVPGIAATLFSIFVMLFPLAARAVVGDQGAYITNAYFSDKLVEVGNVLKPSSVVSVLPANMSGVNGYFIMDVVFVEMGRHQLQIDILDKNAKKIADMAYDPVQVKDKEHVFTVVGSVAGEFPSGWLFFKVFDQINGKERQHLSTFYIMTRDPAEEDREPRRGRKSGQEKKPPAVADKSALGEFHFTPNAALEDQTSSVYDPPGRESGSTFTAGVADAAHTGPASPFVSPSPRTTGYSIYLGSYANNKGAELVTSKVNALGIPSFYRLIEVNGRNYFRVNAGSFADASEAELAAKLIEEKTGIKGSVHDLAAEKAVVQQREGGKKGAVQQNTPPAATEPDLIYVGSFSERKPALDTYRKLEKMQLPVFHQLTKVGLQPFVRLFVGPFSDKEKMHAALKSLKGTLGIKGVPLASGSASVSTAASGGGR
ncbi:MAG: SPOR domain-containing protein [Magnetococcales bacterium]|nr:SPOR domain-containing protein [Magnetococcales bacterium]